MKWYAQIFFSISALMLCAGSAFAAGDFGIDLGADISGYSHEQQDEHTVELFRMYEVKPAAPHPDFDTYAVDTYDGKIIRIMASSPDDYTPDAQKTLAVYKKIREELTKKYGEPVFVQNEIEEAGEDLQEYLVVNDGVEALEWSFSGGDGEPGSVYVFLAGVEDEKGEWATYCTVYTESKDYQGIADRMRQISDMEESGGEEDSESEQAEE